MSSLLTFKVVKAHLPPVFIFRFLERFRSMLDDQFAGECRVESIELGFLDPRGSVVRFLVREEVRSLISLAPDQDAPAAPIETHAEVTVRTDGVRGGEHRRPAKSHDVARPAAVARPLEDVNPVPPRCSHEQELVEEEQVGEVGRDLRPLRRVQPVERRELRSARRAAAAAAVDAPVHVHDAPVLVLPLVGARVRVVRRLDGEVLVGDGDGVAEVSVEEVRLAPSGVLRGELLDFRPPPIVIVVAVAFGVDVDAAATVPVVPRAGSQIIVYLCIVWYYIVVASFRVVCKSRLEGAGARNMFM